MDLKQRVERLKAAFPKSPCFLHNTGNGIGRAEGVWQTGRNYQGNGFYGSYPGNYLARVMAMFPEASGEKTMHLFSGKLEKGNYVRVDIDPKNDPDVIADAQKLSSAFPAESFSLIIADPMYSAEHAKRYGWPMTSRRKVWKECHKILTHGGWLIWLDIMRPVYSSKIWHWGMFFPLETSTNRIIRACYGIQKIG